MELSVGAKRLRNNVLSMFCPSAQQPKAHSLVMQLAELLNGDWRETHQWQHRCSGCCASRAETRTKVERCLMKIVRAMKPNMLAKGNWQYWPRQLNMFGLLGWCHKMLGEALRKALAPLANPQRGDGPAAIENLDRWELLRIEAAKSLKKSLEFLNTEWELKLFVFRGCLGPQIDLMATTLQMDSTEHQLSEMHNYLTAGKREWNIVALQQGVHTHAMLQASVRRFASTSFWPMASTEEFRSDLLVLTCRPAAFVWQMFGAQNEQHAVQTVCVNR